MSFGGHFAVYTIRGNRFLNGIIIAAQRKKLEKIVKESEVIKLNLKDAARYNMAGNKTKLIKKLKEVTDNIKSLLGEKELKNYSPNIKDEFKKMYDEAVCFLADVEGGFYP